MPKDKQLTLKIAEEIDEHTTEKLRRKIDNEITRFLPRKVIFDFSNVAFMDLSLIHIFRWPFVIEGIIIGIVAALLSILVLGIAYSLITNAAANSIISTMGIKLLSFTDMTTLLVIVYMVLGIGIGALGSSISMRKYLQV